MMARRCAAEGRDPIALQWRLGDSSARLTGLPDSIAPRGE